MFCVSHSIDICFVAIRNIRNVHAVSTNETADILFLTRSSETAW